MANTNAPLKKIKDFNDEEKAAILARANKIELPRVAREFGTTWQVVSAIQRAAKNAGKKAKVSAKKTAKAAPAKSAKTAKTVKAASKKAPRTSDEKRLAILKRASEIGITQAAAEAGAARVRGSAKTAAPAKTPAKNKPAANTAKATELKLPAKKSGVYSQIELENEMLKQQVATLTEQVEKLRAAVSKLA